MRLSRFPPILALLAAHAVGCGGPVKTPAGGGGVRAPITVGGDTIPPEVAELLSEEELAVLSSLDTLMIDDSAMQAVFDEAIRQLNDPFTHIITPEQIEALSDEERAHFIEQFKELRVLLSRLDEES